MCSVRVRVRACVHACVCVVCVYVCVSTYIFGKFGAFNAAVQIMETQGTAAAQDVIIIASECFEKLHAIFAVGVACGVEGKSDLLDVLMSKNITCYNLTRYGTNKEGKPEIKNRDITNLETSPFLCHCFNPSSYPQTKTAEKFKKNPFMIQGHILTGDTLVDNQRHKEELLNNYAKDAIGIEMEAGGLFHDKSNNSCEVMIVKGVCDFGDGKKTKEYQPTAALLAAECLHHYLSDENMPKKLHDFKGNATVIINDKVLKSSILVIKVAHTNL